MDFLLERQILCNDHKDRCSEKLSRAFASAALMYGNFITSIAMQIEDNKTGTTCTQSLCEQSLTVVAGDRECAHRALCAA